MGIWINQLGYGATAPTLDYLTREQNELAERVRVSRLLYKTCHRKAYLEEKRTQWNFPKVKVQGELVQLYAPFNLLRRFTNTLTDLLLGEEPMMRSDQQAELDAIADRCDLARVLYDAAREASWASQATVEVIRWDNVAYVQNVPPGELFPIGRRNPDGQFTAYRRFATDWANDGKTRLLLETTYLEGSIERKCYALEGTKKAKDVDLSQWPTKREDGSDLLDKEATGIDWNTVVWLPNELEEGQPVSDYDGSSLIELQDELNAKNTQIARVLAKHSDPKLAAPPSAATPTGTLFSDNDVFFFRTKDEVPSYITWNAELANAIEDRNFVLNAMCIAAEVSQVLLGLKQGATPDAARKLRLEATPTLARIKRKASYVRPFIRTVIDTAVAMENSSRVVKVAMTASVEIRDGLPVDELDEAQVLSTKTGGKAVMSVRRAVEQQLGDPEAVEAEMALLEKDAEAATPAILMGGTGGEAGEEQGSGARVQEQQAAA